MGFSLHSTSKGGVEFQCGASLNTVVLFGYDCERACFRGSNPRGVQNLEFACKRCDNIGN